MPQSQGTTFTAQPLSFVVRHQLWDGNVEEHVDQGVSIDVTATLYGKETSLLRFNCFDIEKSYVYGPENPELSNSWPGRRRPGRALPDGPDHRRQPDRLDHPDTWPQTPADAGARGLQGLRGADRHGKGAGRPARGRSCARETFIAKRNTVKHNRGTDMFEAGNIRFGLEMRRQKNGDGGLALHVLGDVGGSKGKAYVEETELLAFDCFWNSAHYHYGPRNKNHRINWDLTVVDDPLEWTIEQIENRKLGAMIERAGYPGIAADLDLDKIAAVLPALKKRAFEMYEEGERLTGHKGLPLEFTPSMAAE